MADHGIEGVGEVDVDDLLEMLGAENIHDVGSDEVGFSCFYEAGHANGDQNPSAHMNRDKLAWKCKGCGRTGGLVELTRLGLGYDTTTWDEALTWLRRHFGDVIRQPKGSLREEIERRLSKVTITAPPPRLPDEEATAEMFGMDWTSDHEAAVYMRGRGFFPYALEDWGIGWDSWTKRVTIPVRDEDGRLIGFKGRSLDDGNVKYLLLGDTPTRQPRYGVGYGFDMHDARTVVFGLDRCVTDHLVVTEGELDAIACHTAGIGACAPGTTSITSEQLWLLRAHADSLTFFYDSDLAGSSATDSLIRRLTPHFSVFIVPPHEGDAASMAPEEVRDLISRAQHWTKYSLPSAQPV